MSSFKPENAFESALIAAATDPAARLGFYEEIQDADLYVIQGGGTIAGSGEFVIEKGETLQIQNIEHNGRPYLPVFSSLKCLQSVLEEEVSFIRMKAMQFFEITKGADLLLNPGCDYGKELLSGEVESILDGSIFAPQERNVVQEATNVMIGQPSRYPHELVRALSACFAKSKGVKKAYLAHFHNPSTEDPPHTLIAIEYTGDWDRIVSGAGLTAQGVEVPDPPVDFMPIQGLGGIEDYFLEQCKPFYRRKILGFI